MLPNVKPDPWLPFRKPRPAAKVRLFCFPYAGGGASLYRTFQDELPASVEVCAVQLPGRESRVREEPVAEMSRLVGMIAGGLAPHLTPPFAFFGHSMGSMIAFEVARELRRRGRPTPMHLFVSACPPPHIPDDDETHELPDDQMIEKMREIGGMSDELLSNRELMEMILPLFRADAAVTETYLYTDEPPLDLPITAFGGLSDEKATRAQLSEWRQHTTASFTLGMVPGNHFFIRDARAPVMSVLARSLA